MRVEALVGCLILVIGPCWAEPAAGPVEKCLSCHMDDAGQIDIIGIRALSALPPEWPLLFEDAYDLDGDGVAGRLRFVSGEGLPMTAKFGQSLAAARFEDFALIAGEAHDIDLSAPGAIAAVKTAFEARSPDPGDALPQAAALVRFEARGCSSCHVTETYAFEGRTYMPLSDFLLHDLGDGLRRTAPLWGCPECLEADPHAVAD